MTDPVVVTGGAGFIGTHLVRHLLEQNVPVRVLDNERTGSFQRLHQVVGHPPHLTCVKGDIRDRQKVREVVQGSHIIVHLAAQVSVVESMDNPAESVDINVTGTTHILDAARDYQVSRVIFASSCAVYGDIGSPPFNETQDVQPTSIYGLTKKIGEDLCQFYAREMGVDTLILRFFNVYGPLQSPASRYASVVPAFMKALKEGKPLTIYGTGKQTRDFIYVEDLVRLIVELFHRPLNDVRLINLGTGRPLSVLELADEIRQVTGLDYGLQFDPPRPGEMLHAHADIRRLQKLMGSEISFTPLEKGLGNCWRWFTTGTW